MDMDSGPHSQPQKELQMELMTKRKSNSSPKTNHSMEPYRSASVSKQDYSVFYRPIMLYEAFTI